MNLNKRETAAILAGLRLLHETRRAARGKSHFGNDYPQIADILTSGYTRVALDDGEIDNLCEKISCPNLD